MAVKIGPWNIPTGTGSNLSYYWTTSASTVFSWSSIATGVAWMTKEELDESQVKSLKHILTLASADDEELRDLADSLAAANGDSPEEALKVLRTLRQLVLLGQLTEKLAR